MLKTKAQEEQLFRLLAAYAIRNDFIGYCQGMNAIGALLLEILDEEDAFWGLACVVERILPGYHSRTMAGLHTDQRVLGQLVEQYLPKIAAHLRNMKIDMSYISTKWFIGIFIHTLPHAIVLRVWDILLTIAYEGTLACRVLFGVALTILSRVEATILRIDDPGAVLQILQAYDGHLFSPEEVTIVRL